VLCLHSKALLQNRDFTSEFNLIWSVQTFAEKYSASVVGQISDLNSRVSPE